MLSSHHYDFLRTKGPNTNTKLEHKYKDERHVISTKIEQHLDIAGWIFVGVQEKHCKYQKIEIYVHWSAVVNDNFDLILGVVCGLMIVSV